MAPDAPSPCPAPASRAAGDGATREEAITDLRAGWLPRSEGWSARNRQASPSRPTAVLPETLLS
jgi:hypothetical protein